jgi:hypothetical protein
MRRVVLILAAAVTAGSTVACGGGEVAVMAQLEGAATGTQETDAVALGTLPVYLLPYDRDALFDSLAQAYPEPEPEVPDSLFQLQQQVSERQREWQAAENRWGLLRDSLQNIAERMNAMDQSSGEYFALFQDFGDLEDEVSGLEQASQSAFQDFTQLQSRLSAQSREITLERQAWADEAYAPIDSIIEVRLEESGREEMADTTSAQGVATFTGVAAGQWWVYARYDRQYDELYWNEPIEVARGEEIQVRLTEENAEVRQKM